MKWKRIAAYTFCTALASAFVMAGMNQTVVRADDEEHSDPNVGVEVNEENFPDEGFRKYIVDLLDSDTNGILCKEEIECAVGFNFDNTRIQSLKGIEFFPYLETMYFDSNSGLLTELDLSSNTELTDLTVVDSKIETLDLSHNTKLKYLSCSGNIIDTLILGDESNLLQLSCGYNKLTELDLSKCKYLESLNCECNKLTSLNLENCPELLELFCEMNRLKELNFTKCTKLEFVECSSNQLKSLDCSSLKNLTTLSCNYNSLTELKLQGTTHLKTLDMSYNLYLKPDFTGCESLEDLTCGTSYIASIDISPLIHLKHLDASFNYLESLDVSKNTELESLFVTNGKITSLDIRNCKVLMEKIASEDTYREEDDSCFYYIDGEGTCFIAADLAVDFITEAVEINETNFPDKIFREFVSSNFDTNADGILTPKEIENATEIDLSGTEVASLKGIEYLPNIKKLLCAGKDGNGKLASLDVSKNPELRYLDCSQQQLTALNVSSNTKLLQLLVHGNQIKSIDISKCETLLDDVKNEETQAKIVDGHVCFILNEVTILSFDSDTEVKGLEGVTLPTPAPEKEGTIGDFVERLYTEALGRAAEEKGKKYWVEEITSGRRTGGDCGIFFLTGEEFTNRKLSVEDFVETLYKTFFGRESEASGKAYWVGVLKNGGDRTAVIKGFIDSKEWCNLCAEYGVRSGAPTAKSEIASKNAIAFATRLYTCCLGREAEEKGLQYWALALTNLEQTGCSAAKEFFTGAEFTGLKLKDEEYVKRLYTTFMDREPQAGEVSYWTGEISKGNQTRASVLAFFGSSEEFTNICSKYGIERGTI